MYVGPVWLYVAAALYPYACVCSGSGGSETSLTAKLQLPRPANLSAEQLPYVTAHLDPGCRYSIR